MYAFFKGMIEEKTADGVVIEVNGIGYNIMLSPGKSLLLPSVGTETKIYTYTGVREDAINLYGFLTKEELALFRQLISVSGIGPKGGLAILSVLSVDEVKMAIISGNAKAIAKAPGVGAKTAERVIIDLKDKVSIDFETDKESFATESVLIKETAEIAEATEALSALGYNRNEAKEAVRKAKENGCETTEELLKGALRYL